MYIVMRMIRADSACNWFILVQPARFRISGFIALVERNVVLAMPSVKIAALPWVNASASAPGWE
ncbi:hypothetical protein [Vibrio cholerae]|nr:hypothetical protein [Vibrio cholerae]